MQPGRRSAVRPARSLSLALCGLLAIGAAGAVVGPGQARAATTETAFSLRPLAVKDSRLYTEAFAAMRDGRFDAADALARAVSDPALLGGLTYVKLMHPDYKASYTELADWLERYGDQPGADRIYALARRRNPPAATGLPQPGSAAGDAGIWARVESVAQHVEASSAPAAAPQKTSAPAEAANPSLQDAREAFYRGEVETAYKLAVDAGEHWIAGLAAFRLKHYDEAQSRFAAMAVDDSENESVRSGAGYWAARSAIAAGAPEQAPAYLSLAARTPYTFYGLIAERELGLDPAVTPEGLDPAAARPPLKSARGASTAGAPLAGLVKTDKAAHRAAAYAQLGMKDESAAELRAGLSTSAGDERQTWARLGLALNAPLTSPSDLPHSPRTARFDIGQYPTPDLSPQGGFTLDKALVYALVRQESKFNANAAGPGGAAGLMQLMPSTAARVAGSAKMKHDAKALKNPAINLRLGQDYVARLLTAMNGDLLHAVAAYNSGPGVIQKTLAQLGKNSDSLLAMESMPGAQTRDYVKKVVAGYWIYRNLFGQDSPTLDAAASSKRSILAALDKPPAATLTAKLTPQALGSLFKPSAP